MIEQKAIEQTDQQLAEARRIKKERRRRHRNKITRHSCKECGQRKSYICLEHNNIKNQGILYRIARRVRRNLRKFYFSLAVKFGLAQNKKRKVAN